MPLFDWLFGGDQNAKENKKIQQLLNQNPNLLPEQAMQLVGVLTPRNQDINLPPDPMAGTRAALGQVLKGNVVPQTPALQGLRKATGR